MEVPEQPSSYGNLFAKKRKSIRNSIICRVASICSGRQVLSATLRSCCGCRRLGRRLKNRRATALFKDGGLNLQLSAEGRPSAKPV